MCDIWSGQAFESESARLRIAQSSLSHFSTTNVDLDSGPAAPLDLGDTLSIHNTVKHFIFAAS